MKRMWKFYENTIVIFIFLMKECLAEFTYFEQLVEYDSARANCSSRQMMVAKINTHEKWIEMFDLLTNKGRKFPSQDVYIGLIYDQSQNVHKWADGTAADWTKWYTNEPFNKETRRCVRLGVDVDLHFRTTDCTYQHHYLCSTDDLIADSTTKATVNQKPSDNQKDMVVGLSAGFGAFGGVVAACCILCWCCCSKEPTKPHKYTTMRTRNPKMPTYQRQSPGGNSYDTFVTSRSSRMDDFDMDSHGGGGVHRIEIDYDDQRINYNKSEDYSLKIHCPTEDTVSMNDASVSSKKSLETGSGRQPRSHDFLHYM